MQKCHLYVTPSKHGDSIDHIPETAEFTPGQYSTETSINYKAKTFKLMRELAEAEVQSKKTSTKIRHIENEN